MIFTALTEAPVRLDVYLAEATGHTRSQIKQLIDAALVSVDGKTVKAGTLLKGGEAVEVTGTVNRAPERIEGEDLPLNVVYEDEALAVVDKAQGMVVHPAAGHYTGTLVNALLYRYRALSTTGGAFRAGIVHRLDKDTSGLMVIAKTDRAHAFLSEEIACRRAHRCYLALLNGVPKRDVHDIETRIGRDPRDRLKMAVLPEGKLATTHCEVLKRYVGYALAEFRLGTGRTHQIRVHAAQVLRCPVVGDPLYGNDKNKFGLNGQLLHAYRLTFRHPDTQREMTFTSPLPDYFVRILDRLTPTDVEYHHEVGQEICRKE